MSRAASPFSPRTLLAVIVVGAAAFLLFLYAIGAGWDGSEDQDGGAHAAANGLNGFSGLTRLLERAGHDVSLSRSEGRLDDPGLLVLTPQSDADGETLADLIEARRYVGPTLVVLPKWFAMPASAIPGAEAEPGWVMLVGASPPEWIADLWQLPETEARIAERGGWQGLGLSGTLPVPDTVQSLRATSTDPDSLPALIPLVTAGEGEALAGYLNDDGDYPMLDTASGYAPSETIDRELWPVVFVAEPDLLNNYGLADENRARLALALIDATVNDAAMPVVFDLTAAGIGRSQNLLTLAFEPPFLAATLCLLLAALVIGWRAFRRFGPAVAEAPAQAMGKRQLARNGGGLVARAKRLHLLGPPYAALVDARIADALGIREADPQLREAAIARVLAARGLAADYAERADALRRARHPNELLRAAGALRSIERTVTP